MMLKNKKNNIRLICLCVFLFGITGSLYWFFTASKKINPLELPIGTTESLVVLKGRLVGKLFAGPPEYSSVEDGDRGDYCWILQLDDPSLERALTTPVVEPANNLANIITWPNYREVFLFSDGVTEDFIIYRDKEIEVEGYLFHAHTVHHYTPILMNVKRIL